MFFNTGTTSFILYGVFIVLTIIAMFIAFYYIRKGYDADKLAKMIDLFKYCIVSVAIATVTLIISDLYKEREQELKELEYFDKYTNDVKKADGIEPRYELTKYLSIVAPSGELKKSWERYFDTMKVEYQDYLKLKKEKQILDSIKNPTKEEIIKKDELEGKLDQKNAPLIGNQTQQSQFRETIAKPVECYIHFFDKIGLPIANSLSVSIKSLSDKSAPSKTYTYEAMSGNFVLLVPGKYLLTLVFKGQTYKPIIGVEKGHSQLPIEVSLDTVDNP